MLDCDPLLDFWVDAKNRHIVTRFRARGAFRCFKLKEERGSLVDFGFCKKTGRCEVGIAE
jgi:hypothetical protein